MYDITVIGAGVVGAGVVGAGVVGAGVVGAGVVGAGVVGTGVVVTGVVSSIFSTQAEREESTIKIAKVTIIILFFTSSPFLSEETLKPDDTNIKGVEQAILHILFFNSIVLREVRIGF